MAQNQFEIEILDDGKIKVTSPGGFDQEIHANADAFLQMVKDLAGGEFTTESVKNNLASPHSHTHGKGSHQHHH